MEHLQKRKLWLVMIQIIMIFFCYSFFPVDTSYSNMSLSAQSEELSTKLVMVKTTNIWLGEKENRIESSFLNRISRSSLSKNSRKAIHKINSHLPVCFKIGIIHNFFCIHLFFLSNSTFVNEWIIDYIHNLDGKKKFPLFIL